MKRILFADPSPELQLAMDEALLLSAQSGFMDESFRTWSFDRPVVVLGRSSKYRVETNWEQCQQANVTTVRRCSGGATVVGGPGCLMYSVVLSSERHPEVSTINGAHQFVMQRVLAAVQRQLPTAELQGICDLTLSNRKFSGNALRVTKSHVLYHGTMLHAADLDLIDRCLATAPRQPDYRAQRRHRDFIANAALDSERLGDDLAAEFSAQVAQLGAQLGAQALAQANELAETRYRRDSWTFRH